MRVLEWGIYLVVFCLPLYLVRLTIFNIPTNVLELMVGVLFIGWLIIQIRIKNQELRIKNIKKFIIPIILILIGVSVATIFSWDLRVSAGIWKSWFVVPLLFFIILITTVKKPKQIEKIFWAFILSGLVVAIISLIQWNLDGAGRLQGFYTSPNYLAMYLAPALILSIGLFFTKKQKILKILFLVSCFLFLVTLFYTRSVGAWLGIVAAVCFGLLLYLYKYKPAQGWSASGRKIVWAVLVLGLIIIFILVYFKINSDDGKRSFDARLMIWQKALEVFKNYPLTGIGPGTFQDYFPSYPVWGVPQPHNLFLAFLIQTGIIGFIGFIWLLIWFYRTGIKNQESRIKNIILLMVMTCIFIHGLVDTTYWKNDLSMLFWLVVGLMATLKNPQ